MTPQKARLTPQAGFNLLALLVIVCWLALLPSLHRFPPDIQIYYRAAQRLAHGEALYPLHSGYIYPPLLAQALALVPLPRAGVLVLWSVLLAASALITVWLGLRAARLRVPEVSINTQLLSALGFGLLLSEPVFRGLLLGNASPLVAGLLALAANSFWTFPLASGVLLGLATSIKIVPGVLLAWMVGAYMRQRERRFLVGAAAGMITLALSLVHPDTLGYLDAAHDEVQSRLGLGNNLSVFAELERMSGLRVPGVLGPLFGAAAAFALGLRMPAGPAAAQSGWGIAQLIALLSAPVAWSHLYVLALWPALIAAGNLARDSAQTTAPKRWQLEALIMLMVFCILMRVRFFYSPDDVWGSVVFPLIPLIGLGLIARRLFHDWRQPVPQPSAALGSSAI
ncbi:MAG TPA: glycosyltransferase family 87 protein [Polyangiales bacterium]|nr:glycosyltransferase family 87 protein [Polyangiales bacterium]